MKEIKMFQCEVCGDTYKTEEEVDECEAEHELPIKDVKQAFMNKEVFSCQIVKAFRHMYQSKTSVTFKILDGSLKNHLLLVDIDTSS